MNRILLMPMLVSLGACGGSSSSTTDRSGIFLDSPVINLAYRTPTLSGVTDLQGRFNYVQGESVTFSIGDLDFSSVVAKSVVTPLDTCNTGNIDNACVINTIRLLQTLDKDANLENGITIAEEAHLVATPLDFSLEVSAFENSSAVTSLIFNAGQNTPVLGLVNFEDALDHFEEQLSGDLFLKAIDRTYVLNGTEMQITNPELDSDRSGNIQFNLKNNNRTPRQMVQVTTKYLSKQEFDNAFSGNLLILTEENTKNAGIELDGTINSLDRSTISVRITANEDGGYGLKSSGSMSSQDGAITVSNIVVNDVYF